MSRKTQKKNGAASKETSPPLAIEVIEATFAALEPQGDVLVQRFYEELFQRHPEVQPLFAYVTPEEQQRKLLAALTTVVQNLRRPEALHEVLSDLGTRHEGYGAQPEHYPAVVSTLLDVMQECAGDLWTEEVHTAWSTTLNRVATMMLQTDQTRRTGSMATTNNTKIMNEETMADYEGQLAAINKAQAVIEFAMDGTILTANDNFLNTLGYTLDEIRGQHHRMFVDAAFAQSDEYKAFWAKLNRGEYEAAEYKRLGKGGKEVWIQASYNPIFDRNGKPVKVVKYATDVTERRAKDIKAAELARLGQAVNGVKTAVMMIDRDLVVTYANQATMAVLKQHEQTLQSLYPGFSADGIVGTCIDIFHKNPAHQRQLLGNPANLPYSTDIQVGPLTFQINVTAILDTDGTYVGSTLEWYDVAEIRAKETEVARLQQAVDGAMTAIMMVDRDLVITYANQSTLKLLTKHEEALQSLYRSFSVDNLIGTCIDIFHKNPAHQRRLLDDSRNLPYSTTIQVGPLSFQINVSAIHDAGGNYTGNTMEWSDVTEQLDAQGQIEQLIHKAVAGELDERIDATRYEGFMKNLSDGVNTMMDTVVTPIQETTRVVSGLAEGDLMQTMEGAFQGQFAELCDAVNASFSNLLRMVSEIREAASSITSAAAEISQGNGDLSQRTEEQAASLQETASSMEELTDTVKQNADNAHQANQLAASARDQAEKGGDVVGNAIAAMTEINSSSKKIADIIGVIDEIAFQTNLLALNAAVEAARAGEQGRGFAVVAAEVRNLAQRSAGAAKEIKTLIKDSVEKVEDGSRLVNDSGKTLEEIVGAVKKVSDIIAEIASASQEQSAGIEQVNKAVAQMDEVTQQNAALVEEMAAASESMDEQAQGLEQLMAFFKVGEEESAPAASRSRRSRRNEQQEDDAPTPTRSRRAKAAPEARRNGKRRPSRNAKTNAQQARVSVPADDMDVEPSESEESEWAEF